ncbi:MAG: carbonic anhydrase [Patescibacteria group bacterium]
MGEGETFFTVVGCMDGRIQKPLAELGTRLTGAEHPDTLTHPGMVGFLADPDITSTEVFERIVQGLNISTQGHKTKGVLVAGHEECLGYPVEDDNHRKTTVRAAEKIKHWFRKLDVHAAYVGREPSGLWTARVLPMEPGKEYLVNPSPTVN